MIKQLPVRCFAVLFECMKIKRAVGAEAQKTVNSVSVSRVCEALYQTTATHPGRHSLM